MKYALILLFALAMPAMAQSGDIVDSLYRSNLKLTHPIGVLRIAPTREATIDLGVVAEDFTLTLQDGNVKIQLTREELVQLMKDRAKLPAQI